VTLNIHFIIVALQIASSVTRFQHVHSFALILTNPLYTFVDRRHSR